MSAENPYQAPQSALTPVALPIHLQQLIPWEEDGRRTLQEVAKCHRWMMRLYIVFLLYGCCCMFVGYLGSKYLSKKAGDLLALQIFPLYLFYPLLIYYVYQLAKLLNRSWTPLISLLMMLLVPYSLAVPIFYHRRAVKLFAQFDIRLGLLGIRPAQLDTQIDANYDAHLAQAPPSFSDVAQTL
jgi:hypothetical protein